MRLKTFQAPSMPEAMNLVREELAADAIIVSTHDSGRSGVSVGGEELAVSFVELLVDLLRSVEANGR